MTIQNIPPIQLFVEFIVALSILIFTHEFGHFIVCKLVGVEVEEFGFGYPPRALTMFTLGGTKFTLNWLPFGGFVRPKGDTDPNTPGGLASANPWKRIAVFLAGPVMSIMTAVVLFIAIYGVLGSLPDRNRVSIVGIVSKSPAEAAGLQAGDILVSVNGIPIHSLDAVKPVIVANPGQPLNYIYERDGVNHEVSITSQINPGSDPTIGIYMNYPMKPFTIWGAIPESFTSLYDYMKELFAMIGQLIRGQSTTSEGGVMGVVGMFKVYSSMRDSSNTSGIPAIVNVFLFFASISISLGLLNLLPIPALDGGRIIFTLPEIIIRRRIPPKYEMWVNLISFGLLILLMIVINAHDIFNPITITPVP